MGHLIIADHMVVEGLVDKVVFVVSPQNPFKTLAGLAHEHDRFEMVRLATYGHTQFEASDVEFRMPRPSYTIDTLSILSEKYPQRKFTLIMGQDNLSSLPKWKNYEALLKFYSILAYPRSGATYAVPEALTHHASIRMVSSPNIELSATFLRQRIKAGKSIQFLTPDVVAAYIHSKGLYL